MSRLSFFFTTLIAAVPAAFLGYLCVMAFLHFSDKLPPILMGVAGITLLLCAAVIAMPAAVLLKGRGAAKSSEGKAAKSKTDDEPEAAEVVPEDEAAAAEAHDDDDVFIEGEAHEFEDFEDENSSK